MFLYKNLFFSISSIFNPNRAYWNQRRLFSGGLPGMFFFVKSLKLGVYYQKINLHQDHFRILLKMKLGRFFFALRIFGGEVSETNNPIFHR